MYIKLKKTPFLPDMYEIFFSSSIDRIQSIFDYPHSRLFKMKNVNICFVGFLILPLLTAIASPVPQDDTDTDFLVADATDATVPQYYPQNDDEYSGKQTQQYPQNSDGNIGDQVSETGSPSSGLNLPTTNYETAMAYNIDATQNTEGSGELLAGSAGAVVKPNSVDCGGQTPLCCDDGRRSESADFRVNCILCKFFYPH